MMKPQPYRLYGLLDWFTSTGNDNPSMEATYRANMQRVSDKADQLRADGTLAAFATMTFALDVTESQAREFQKRAYGIADKLYSTGQVGRAWYEWTNWFANLGVLIYPSRDQVSGDPEAVDAVNAMLVKFGWADLKKDITNARYDTARAVAAEAENRTAFWENTYQTMYYVSGAVAVDKCLEYVKLIGESVRATRQVLATAQRELTPQQYGELVGMTAPMNKALQRMNKYVKNAEEETGGMLGNPGPVLVLVVVAGVILIILAGIYATVEMYRIRVTERANEMIEARRKAIQESLDAERRNIEMDPGLTAQERADSLKRLERERRDRMEKLPVPKAAPKSDLPGLTGGVGMLAIGGAAIAAVILLGRK